MKVLHIINDLRVGGAEKLIVDMAPIMVKFGIHVDILVLQRQSNSFERQLKSCGVNIYSIKTRSLYCPSLILKMRKYLKSGYDIVHVHLFPSQYWAVLSSLLLKNRPILVTTEHNTHNRRRNIAIFKIIDRFIYSYFEIIIAISNATANNLSSYIKRKSNIVTIPNGISLDTYYGASPISRKQLGLGESDFIITMVGAFREQKDQDTIIRSLKLLPERVKLVLVGDGVRRKECEFLSTELNLKDRVVFLGERNDIPSILKAVDVCIVSSHWEGFGLVAVEGMAASKPVIASRVEGLSGIVDSVGLLFERGNYKELANKVNLLMTNTSLYNEVATRCYQESQSYDINNMVRKIIEEYKYISKI